MKSILDQQNCVGNCAEENSGNSQPDHKFRKTEDFYRSDQVKLYQTNQYAASVLLTNNTIFSRYLEGSQVNRVQLDLVVGDKH